MYSRELPLTSLIGYSIAVGGAAYCFLHKRTYQLALDIKGITIGPKPPAFVTPNVFAVMQEKWDLRLTGEDAKAECAAALA